MGLEGKKEVNCYDFADALISAKDVAYKAVMKPVEGTGITPQFGHIMSGGYAAGYYSYKWAEMLDADAFARFKEEGIMNMKVAQSFRDNILSKGDSEHPMELYTRFRGHRPQIEPLLERDGIKTICKHL